MWERPDPFQAAIGRAVDRQSVVRAEPLSLIEFTRRAWPVIKPHEEWQDCSFHEENAVWGEALISGLMPRQLHCGPSRSGKSTIFVVMLNAWAWTFVPWMQFLTASHSHSLAEEGSTATRRVVESEWYQSLWPLKLRDDQNRKGFFANVEGGHRQIASVGGNTTGLGGMSSSATTYWTQWTGSRPRVYAKRSTTGARV
ncbi:MAG: hypothetical protein HC814_01085 [Rhodobacteraceae bacterium]|nr:hypothetical protein [Paracoccaceae bacterium]